MLKLMKYELRKSQFSKIVMMAALGLSELLFLFGVFFTDLDESSVVAWGIAALVIVTIVGIAFIGIESMLILHKDLNTKQSYMLFMTSNSGYKILGAKIIENAFAICVASAFFLLLAAVDITILMTKLGGIKEIFRMLESLMNIDIDWAEVRLMAAITFCEGVIGWFSMIVTGYLAIILSASVFAGRKFNGILTFVLYLVLTFAQERIILLLTKLVVEDSYMTVKGILFFGGVSAAFAIAIYIVSGWMLDKKLSV